MPSSWHIVDSSLIKPSNAPADGTSMSTFSSSRRLLSSTISASSLAMPPTSVATLPYICHGIEGSRILRLEGFPRHALVCERHTGAGLTIDDIRSQSLPLPLRDMTPQSLEEKLICYADKFFSKSGDIYKEKSLDKVISSMSRHGEETLHRFLHLHQLFG